MMKRRAPRGSRFTIDWVEGLEVKIVVRIEVEIAVKIEIEIVVEI